jgi:hypothetical protein
MTGLGYSFSLPKNHLQQYGYFIAIDTACDKALYGEYVLAKLYRNRGCKFLVFLAFFKK